MGLSRMCKKCRECKCKDDCQNKRMEALNYIVPKEITIQATISPNTNELNRQIEKMLNKICLPSMVCR